MIISVWGALGPLAVGSPVPNWARRSALFLFSLPISLPYSSAFSEHSRNTPFQHYASNGMRMLRSTVKRKFSSASIISDSGRKMESICWSVKIPKARVCLSRAGSCSS